MTAPSQIRTLKDVAADPLIGEALRKKFRGNIPKPKVVISENVRATIFNDSELLRIANEHYAGVVQPLEPIYDGVDLEQARSQTVRAADVRVSNLLGHVDEPTWKRMLDAYLDGRKDHLEIVQPNGDWRLVDFSVQTYRTHEQRSRAVSSFDEDGKVETVQITNEIPRMIIVMKFLDFKGENDLIYKNGRPVGEKDDSQAQMLEKILAQMANSGGGGTDAVTQMLLQQMMAQNAALQARLDSLEQRENTGAPTPQAPAQTAAEQAPAAQGPTPMSKSSATSAVDAAFADLGDDDE